MSATEAQDPFGEPTTEAEQAALDALRCLLCGDVIGVYEPLVTCERGAHARTTSRAAEPGLESAGGAYYHRACYSALG